MFVQGFGQNRLGSQIMKAYVGMLGCVDSYMQFNIDRGV